MNSQDEGRLAIDSIRQMAYSMPSNYKAGLVIYNDGVLGTCGLEETLTSFDTLLTSIQYTGYTNAGAGLNQALELFSESENTKRYIVMISDGEIDMGSQQEADQSKALFTEAAGRAKEKEIQVHIVAIGREFETSKMSIFSAAEMTGGNTYWADQNTSLHEIANELLFTTWEIPRRSVGIADGDNGKLNVNLPGTGADRVKILLVSGKGMKNVAADYSAASAGIITGQKFTVIDIEAPARETMGIQFEAADAAGLQAYMITEFSAVLDAEMTYSKEEIEAAVEDNSQTVNIQHFADIKITAVDAENKSKNLWNNSYYENQEVIFTINGETFSGEIEDGFLSARISADGVETISLSVDLESLQEIYYLEQPLTMELAVPADAPPVKEVNYMPLGVTLGFLVFAVFVILLIGLFKHKKKEIVSYSAMPEATDKSRVKKEIRQDRFDYTGKLNFYVVKTKDGSDIPPQTFRLYGRGNKELTLDWILKSCGIDYSRIGAGDIFFYPGPDRSLILTSHSEGCTILKGRELVMRDYGYPVNFDEKVTITFEDECTELEVHYKNIKPSERN